MGEISLRRPATRVAGAVAAALIAATGCGGGQAPSPARPAASSPAASAPSRTAGGTEAAAPAVRRIPLTVPNQAQARKAVTLASCAGTKAGGHAAGTIAAPGTSAATFTITVFFTTRQATVLGYAATTVRAAPGQATPWKVSGHFTAPPGLRCVLRGVTASKAAGPARR
jgi:hypothetical protein